MPDKISAPGSFPYSETRARIARFSQSVLSEEAWFRAANELIAAMELLEPHIEYFGVVSALKSLIRIVIRNRSTVS